MIKIAKLTTSRGEPRRVVGLPLMLYTILTTILFFVFFVCL